MNNLRCRRHAWKHKEDEEEEKLEMIQTKHENHQRDM